MRTVGEISDPGEDNDSTEADDEDNDYLETARAARPMGQLVLRFSWIESCEGGREKEQAGGKAGYTTLVVHGASGLAKADL